MLRRYTQIRPEALHRFNEVRLIKSMRGALINENRFKTPKRMALKSHL